MAQDGKLDLLLKTIEGNEKRRVEAEERAQGDFADLKRMVEHCLPMVEKKVEELSEAVQTLSQKVDQIEGSVAKPGQAIDTTGQNSPWLAAQDATWEDLEDPRTRFLEALAWGQAKSQEEGIVKGNPAAVSEGEQKIAGDEEQLTVSDGE